MTGWSGKGKPRPDPVQCLIEFGEFPASAGKSRFVQGCGGIAAAFEAVENDRFGILIEGGGFGKRGDAGEDQVPEAAEKFRVGFDKARRRAGNAQRTFVGFRL